MSPYDCCFVNITDPVAKGSLPVWPVTEMLSAKSSIDKITDVDSAFCEACAAQLVQFGVFKMLNYLISRSVL